MSEQQVQGKNKKERSKENNKKNKLGWLWKSVIVVFLLSLSAPFVILFLASDSNVLVVETATVNANSATKAKDIVKTVYGNLTNATQIKSSKITLTEDEINGVLALAMRGVKGLKGRVNVTPVGIKSAFSFLTPQNPFCSYINVTTTVIPSSRGLYIDGISIGRLVFSGELAITLVETFLNVFLGNEAIGTKLLHSIKTISVRGAKLTVEYRSIPNFKQSIAQAMGKVKGIREELSILAEPDDVKVYYQSLCTLHAKIGVLGHVPLSYYLSEVFVLAEKRSRLNKPADEENKAAILALAIFLGAAEFDSFIGAIDGPMLAKCQPKRSNIVIEKRNDLRLHFVFSAALKIISDSSISFAIGEFKELLDSGEGGTGFSFTDLAADRSGIRFAEFAVSPSGALRLQSMAAELTEERVFFPSLAQLPDGISQQEFEMQGGFEGEFYKEHLAIINKRINQLSLYR